MPIIITPDSDLGKEQARWNRPKNQFDEFGVPGMNAVGYVPYPKMVYKAATLPNGKDVCGQDEWEIPGPPGQPPQTMKVRTTLTVNDEREHKVALSNGYHPTPGQALKALEETANAAAYLAHDNRRMSAAAKAELQAANDEAGLDHVLDVEVKRRPGRPKKVESVD
jgi:hypothetical protein